MSKTTPVKQPTTEELLKRFPRLDLSAAREPKIIKEVFAEAIDMRGPGDRNAPLSEIGTVCVIRFSGNAPVTVEKIAALFNEAAKDFPGAPANKLAFTDKGAVEIYGQENIPADYKRLAPKVVGFRG